MRNTSAGVGSLEQRCGTNKHWERIETTETGYETRIDCLVCGYSLQCAVNASAIVRKETSD